ncbi:DUF6270 domain-containing protein [Blautia sp. An46]|uniref:DUF6270 domain-containing protein n=1 Tax=Blautia sp. An46 TaxID=1965636 RepID=UPI0013A5F6CB|nr:DUF6270 domain-containing protein [Blautia sp. An46]
MICTIDIHGSCVSRDVFRDQDDIKVKTYIARNSIMSTQYPLVREKFTDTSSNNSPWEKRMLDIDFSKSLFKHLADNHGDYLMIDLIDEIFELIKVRTFDGKESAVTNSQVLKRSDYMKILGIKNIEIINTRNFHFSKIIDAIKNYCKNIIDIYGEEHIIINEAYPVEKMIDKDSNVKFFDEERRNNVKRNRYKLELYYALLEYEMPKAFVIKMPKDIYADENHRWGKATTHFEERFYSDVYEQTLKFINHNKNHAEKHIIDPVKSKNYEDDKQLFDARDIKNKNIIIWGAQIYFKENIERFKKKYNKIKYIFPDGPVEAEIGNQYTIIESLEDIKKINNCVVIIAKGKTENISKIAETLMQYEIPYDHMDFYIHSNLNIRYLKALKHYNYIDENNNKFIIHPDISDKLVLNRICCSNANCAIGNNKIHKQLFIQLMGERPDINIGKDSSFLDVIINVCSNGKVIIGDDNMFSHGITLAQSDMHHIFDLQTGNRINYPKDIIIGNHVWVGREVEFLGGANIGDNCVVGARTVTSSKFPNNVVLAGCPGKIIREDIIWARDDLKIYNHDNYKEAVDKLGEKYIHKELPE